MLFQGIIAAGLFIFLLNLLLNLRSLKTLRHDLGGQGARAAGTRSQQ